MPSPFEKKPLHATDGKVHVGTALILASLAIVVSSLLVLGASAQTTRPTREPNHTAIFNELRQLNRRMEKLESVIERVSRECLVEAKQCEPLEDGEEPIQPPAPSADTCLVRCEEDLVICKRSAEQNEEAIRACNTKYQSCRRACTQ